MERNLRETFLGWEMLLNRNVYMYTHSLTIRNGEQKFSIDCEDLPAAEKTIGIWLHSLDLPEQKKTEVIDLLQQWTKRFDVKFHIYITKDKFVTNFNDL